LKIVYYYYVADVGKVQQLVYGDPLTEAEMIINGYKYLKSEKVEQYPWEVIE